MTKLADLYTHEDCCEIFFNQFSKILKELKKLKFLIRKVHYYLKDL